MLNNQSTDVLTLKKFIHVIAKQGLVTYGVWYDKLYIIMMGGLNTESTY